ncbi:MAG: HAD-IIIA family hydrolase [Bacteroidales bacterium]|nr:HAD-IIIA family hydrolase [Bacteroidales bacterium]
MNLKDLSFTKDWTLFLDRDGVISRRLPDDYVKHWEDFRFLDGVLDAMAVFGKIFGRIIIVSNQQGVGKGLMSAESLKMIDFRMKQEVIKSGGRIDASYYCTHLESENHPDRKPGTGMGLKAKAEFPEIDFSKSVMVGDSLSDLEFGKRLGMITVFINDNEDQKELADFQFLSLSAFALTLHND